MRYIRKAKLGTPAIGVVQHKGGFVMNLSTIRRFTAVLFISSLIYGCGGNSASSGGGSFLPLTGDWVGTWRSGSLTDEGLIRASLVEDDDGNISGTATFTGFPCFLTSPVTGIASGIGVSLTFTSGGRVTFLAQRNTSNDLDGNYSTDAGACFVQGSFSLDRA